jgi:ketosteroid isomerase-like protein
MMNPEPRRAISRRTLLRRGSVLGVAAGLAAVSAPAFAATIPAAAPPDITELFNAFFAAKSAHSPDRTMSFFDPDNTTYTDAIVGWQFPTWSALKALFDKYMPAWPAAARSYQTRILGDANGAVVFFTNTPEEFGHEIRGLAVVDIRNGKFVRWVDYWDGRHFGVAATESLRTPPAEFPTNFGESKVGDDADPTMTAVTQRLSQALGQGDSQAAAQLFSPDAVFEDLTLHTAIVGYQSIAGYLSRSAPSLPYGQGAQVRHLVGGSRGGAYEWTNQTAQVPRGVTAIELDAQAQIKHLWSMWDGSLVTPSWITQEMSLATES